jgi:hypothetical protein
MAYQVGPSCYGDAIAAVHAIASSQVGTVVVHGGSAYVADATAVTATSISYTLQPIAGGASISYVASVSPQPCGLLDWQDGLMLGWAVAAAWIAVAAVMLIRRGVHE